MDLSDLSEVVDIRHLKIGVDQLDFVLLLKSLKFFLLVQLLQFILIFFLLEIENIIFTHKGVIIIQDILWVNVALYLVLLVFYLLVEVARHLKPSRLPDVFPASWIYALVIVNVAVIKVQAFRHI